MKSKHLSKVEAAYQILGESKKPMHVRDIINIAVKRNLITFTGKTPQSTLAVDMLLENRRREKQNLPIRFEKVSPRVWTLTK
jgi:hypothetical protein